MLHKPQYINVNGKLMDLSVPKVMGIINVTPDSFYSGSRVTEGKTITDLVRKMTLDGADIIDVGGYSSRPGAADVDITEEKERVISAIRLIRSEFPEVVISVDTFRSDVALEAVKCGAAVINDISAGDADKKMFDVVIDLNVPYIMMHMQGTPATMQKDPQYDDVVADILRWAGKKITYLQSKGVKDLIFDPGFGFGKTSAHNFEMLNRLTEFSVTGLPLLVGLSRKSMIWKNLGSTPDEALNGTTVLNTVALMKGADILRVHDVREAVETVKLFSRVKEAGGDLL